MTKILIIEPSNIGDVILTFPALSALFGAYPQAQYQLLCSPRGAELFTKDPRVRHIWMWRKKASLFTQAALLTQLFLERFRLVIDFRHSLIPIFLLPAQRTPLVRRWHFEETHRAQQHMRAVAAAVGRSSKGENSALIWSTDEDETAIQSFLDHRPLLVLAPGARSHLKRWQASGFARLADRLSQERGMQVALVGEKAEESIAREVASLMQQPPVNLCGRTSLSQLAALFKKAALVITNDSACLHAADSVGTPTVAIFGPTDPKKYGPRNPRSKVVRLSLICSPCERALCPYGHECMKWLGVEEVYQAAKDLLG